jgi:hypothetical protein
MYTLRTSTALPTSNQSARCEHAVDRSVAVGGWGDSVGKLLLTSRRRGCFREMCPCGGVDTQIQRLWATITARSLLVYLPSSQYPVPTWHRRGQFFRPARIFLCLTPPTMLIPTLMLVFLPILTPMMMMINIITNNTHQ